MSLITGQLYSVACKYNLCKINVKKIIMKYFRISGLGFPARALSLRVQHCHTLAVTSNKYFVYLKIYPAYSWASNERIGLTIC